MFEFYKKILYGINLDIKLVGNAWYSNGKSKSERMSEIRKKLVSLLALSAVK